jgi:hypothetical protein
MSKLLHNRVAVGEWARITATYPRSSLERHFEGYVTATSAHRLTIMGEELRRVDIVGIEVNLNHDANLIATGLHENVGDFIDGLVEAALWADLQWPEEHEKGGDNGESGGGNTEYGVEDVEVGSLAKLRDLAERFIIDNQADLKEYAEQRAYDPIDGDIWAHIGHDAWLSAGGHGTGFWDRQTGALGDRLHEAATKVFGRFEGSGLPWLTPTNTISFIH